jgi:hypothetical protein
MTVAFLATIFEFLGGLMIAITALLVHHSVWKEKGIDSKVIKEIGHERVFAILGIIFMFVGFSLRTSIELNLL